VEAGDASAIAAAKVVAFHAQRFQTFAEAILGGSDDPEHVHDMRVAIRRIRAALEVFARFLPVKLTRMFGKALRKATRRLGRVRDLDLLVLDLQTWIEAEPDHKTAQPALDELCDQRDRARSRLRNYLLGSDFESLGALVPAYLDAVRSGEAPVSGRGSRTVAVAAPILILEAEADALDARPVDVGDLDFLHRFRIALKRLRYTVEAFQELLAAPGDECLGALRRHQDSLGGIQDARIHGDKALMLLDSGRLARDCHATIREYANQRFELAHKLAAEYALGHDVPWDSVTRKRLFVALAGLKGHNP
jgi:adenylate cyclase